LINVHDLDLIAQARRLCDRLVLGVYSDELVLSTTGRPPVVPLAERLALVSHVRGVADAVVHTPDARPAGPEVVVFAEQVDDIDELAVIRLEVARQTESATLRDALRPVREVAA
jgi:glycerol-3-phosphate cytidylyltransferase-like family protein